MGEILVKTGEEYILYSKDNNVLGITSGTIEGRKLSKQNCEAIENGYDLDELSKTYANKDSDITNDFGKGHREGCYVGYLAGFKQALKILGDKKYNYGHLDKMFTCGKLYQDSKNEAYCFDNVLSKFEQTEWEVEIVTKPYTVVGEGFELELKREPKLDKDGCLILKKK